MGTYTLDKMKFNMTYPVQKFSKMLPNSTLTTELKAPYQPSSAPT